MAKNDPVFEIVNETARQEYKVTTDTSITTGNIERQQGNVISISGSSYQKGANGEQGDYIGNFNGRMTNGEMKYAFSEMTKQQADICWSAINVIEANVFEQPAE